MKQDKKMEHKAVEIVPTDSSSSY